MQTQVIDLELFRILKDAQAPAAPDPAPEPLDLSAFERATIFAALTDAATAARARGERADMLDGLRFRILG